LSAAIVTFEVGAASARGVPISLRTTATALFVTLSTTRAAGRFGPEHTNPSNPYKNKFLCVVGA
jgi:hypothetical protein